MHLEFEIMMRFRVPATAGHARPLNRPWWPIPPRLQQMKRRLAMLVVVLVPAIGCERPSQSGIAASAQISDPHREAIAGFHGAQRRFKELIATVRDEKSFDAAKPALDIIVSDFRRTATSLSHLLPPPEAHQREIRQQIADSHRVTEPTGEDMLGLLSIETRAAEVNQWLGEFSEAGRKAGAEMLRLYGQQEQGR